MRDKFDNLNLVIRVQVNKHVPSILQGGKTCLWEFYVKSEIWTQYKEALTNIIDTRDLI